MGNRYVSLGPTPFMGKECYDFPHRHARCRENGCTCPCHKYKNA